MVDRPMRSRALVGSNRAPNKGKNISGGRLHRRHEQPQAPSRSHTNDFHSANSQLDHEDTSMPAPSLRAPRLTELQEAQGEQERRSRPVRKRTISATTNEDEAVVQRPSPNSSHENDGWEKITPSPPLPTTPPFPGTWPAALHDTTTALTQVSRATKSYASAVASSGIGKASWSVGVAALSTVNKTALSVAGWGIRKTGLMPNELPRPVAMWIVGKEERERKRRLVEERRRRYSVEYGERLEVSFKDEHGEFEMVMHEMDSTGAFRGRGPKDRLPENRRPESRQDIGIDYLEAQKVRVREQEDYEEEGLGEQEDSLLKVFEFDDDGST